MDTARFEAKLQQGVDSAKVVLEGAKAPCFPSAVHHHHDDKYLLAELVTNAAAASQLNGLTSLGVLPEHLAQLQEWAKVRPVSLCFVAEERCTFLREVSRDEESPTRSETSLSMGGLMQGALTSKVVTKITEYFWQYEVTWQLKALQGVGDHAQPNSRLQLMTRRGQVELKTTTKSAPRPEARVPAIDTQVPISWLLQQLKRDESDWRPMFQIDRLDKLCHTPRRNPAVDQAMSHFQSFARWAKQVAQYLEGILTMETEDNALHRGSASQVISLHSRAETFFVPVLPLMFEEAGGEAKETEHHVLTPVQANQLLAEEARVLAERRIQLGQTFQAGEGIATVAEAVLSMDLRHYARVCEQWSSCLDYIEGLLRQQLVAAIGKEVTAADFAEYMCFHNRKLFAEAYVPVPFSFAVRRSCQHAPEGTVSIEQLARGPGGNGHVAAPIFTMVARSARPHSMELPLSASTTVRFGGERYLHAWLSHKFSTQTSEKLSLVARARQFSSFLVVIGRIASATAFEPKYAAIVKNKDELTIPLDLSTIPTPKEFKDAIESLSPEQQAFAQAFRAMQLESTLFGVLVIQIKPQLERVLNLLPDSLTKEIKLTQELMELFIKYQIPSDLLSYDPEAGGAEVVGGASATERLNAVKAHVLAMNEVIIGAKQDELSEKRMEMQVQNYSADPFASAGMPLSRGAGLRGGSRGGGMQSCGDGGGTRGFDGTRGFGGPKQQELCMKGSSGGMKCFMKPKPVSQQQQAQPQQRSNEPQQSRPEEQRQPQPGQRQSEGHSEELEATDYTQVPREMDRRFERLDVDGALRPTVITAGQTWSRRAQQALLAAPVTQSLGSTEQKHEKDAAFDLLDALTKSGGLAVDSASLHIVIAATHCFDKNVTETLVRDNMNPIDKVERSTLIMASTVHALPPATLIRDVQCPRVKTVSPMLFLEDL